MKYILLGLFLLPSLIQAQLLTSNGNIIGFDTIAIINLVPIQDSSIRIVNSKLGFILTNRFCCIH